MLNFFTGLLKAVLFAAIVLILGNSIRWGDRTISDQVRMRMSHPEPAEAVNKVRDAATQLVQDTREGLELKAQVDGATTPIPSASAHTAPIKAKDPLSEAITPSERQKLRALIRELNRSSARN